MLTLTPTAGTPSTGSYCVQGNTLHLVGTNAAGSVISDQVGQRI
jgi:hypothetical protein